MLVSLCCNLPSHLTVRSGELEESVCRASGPRRGRSCIPRSSIRNLLFSPPVHVYLYSTLCLDRCELEVGGRHKVDGASCECIYFIIPRMPSSICTLIPPPHILFLWPIFGSSTTPLHSPSPLYRSHYAQSWKGSVDQKIVVIYCCHSYSPLQ